jgi:hypothetical protein
MVHTHTHPNQYVNIQILQCYGIKGYTDTEVTANRPDIIIKNKKEKTCILIYVAIPVDRNVMQKEAEKKATKIQELMYKDTTNVEHEMYDYTGNN